MLYHYISRFNWIDIALIVVVLRMSYIGMKQGFPIEVFKLINVFFCSFICLHFYTSLGNFIHNILKPLPAESAGVFSYVLLCVIITLIFRVLREGFLVFVKIESITRISQIAGTLVGSLRAFIISGLIMYGLLISQNHYLIVSVRSSLTGPPATKSPVAIYDGILKGFVERVFPGQAFNRHIIETLEEKPKK